MENTPALKTETSDRCDARGCPAGALVFVEKSSGLALAFCGHCFDMRHVALLLDGFQVRDDIRPVLRRREAERR
jgi:hypothetical protein